ncbi:MULTISPECIES: hypothetical protein [unclassified Mesorhizobium]|uniref:hypothetical protein n=1 Tax=unclassified Mesorhizobium TaxID=325217 RepID=UPI000FE7E3E6|nr:MULTISPECIES: hypothetical protein [unclassified Mesorhizobium]RWC90656.1 MAG: hypothetical protein EOS72_07310 [Mesorhizobium sp.]TGT87201.1 hypothetical protein EN804_19090 [Mesorhizobium sp. M8A.F.Ca.ET.161.01.1.1]TGV41067.1 hypothetical protein EN785_19075 [Mesorhizobium sp. M8A.F.Ca.ET.142.01.1.1]TGW05188.1 hypothetical protein EN788_48795 [Mesorhizobium sp. M2D.F.Ca.ET.145.01.1.1]
MTTKRLEICVLALAMGCCMSSTAFAGAKHRHNQQGEQERYVPAEDDLIDFLFGGPRYYDQQLVTTAAGACSYQRTGPDGFAINKINDHHCGK